MNEFLFTALSVGFIGSVHCIGMCGPIALALPRGDGGKAALVGGRLLYNSGRIITYAALGALFGAVGGLMDIAGLQQTLSIVIGVLVILAVLLPARLKARAGAALGGNPLGDRVRRGVSALFRSRKSGALLGIGLLNGLLPCGFVYIGIAGAVLGDGPLEGMLYMTMFGLGTIPLMLLTSLAGDAFGAPLRRRIARLIPAMAFVLGVLFVARGLALDIPLLSPPAAGLSAQEPECCH